MRITDLIQQKTFWVFASVASLAVFGGYRYCKYLDKRLTPEKVAAGKVLFEHQWQVNDELSANGDGLGPVFNGQSCAQCHSQGGLGGSSGLDGNITSFEVLPDLDRKHVVSNVVHHSATDDTQQETRKGVVDLFPFIKVTLRESRNSMASSDYGSGGSCGGPPRPTPPPQPRPEPRGRTPVIFHELNSPALFGAGLIDEISSASISFKGLQRTVSKIGKEFAGDFDQNSVGMARTVKGGIGKFGWKGQHATLEGFVAAACATELGLSNPLESQGLPNQFEQDKDSQMDMTRKQLNELVAFVRSLPRPEQVLPEDKKEQLKIAYGEKVFNDVGCADCHVKDLGKVTGVYTDFHLYNLEELSNPASGYVSEEIEDEFRVPSDHPEPDQWQTPALWGVADSAPYFHDGRSPTLESAILRHDGDARHSKMAYADLSNGEKELLIKFLNTLRAPGMGDKPPAVENSRKTNSFVPTH